MPHFEQKVAALYSPKRADVYLAEILKEKFSRQELKAVFEQGEITVNGKAAKPSLKLREGDLIEARLPKVRDSSLLAESIPIKVIYEDADILVIDKPSGMVVHPGAGNRSGTLVNALLGRGSDLSTAGGSERPGIVHRLDKETSGILLVAKNNRAHRALQEQFESRSLSKTYIALVKGRVEFEEGHVDKSIGKHKKIRQKRAVSDSETAREAQTRYRVLKRFRYATLLEVKILTGRTHQIRVHMQHLGYPVAGDELYGTRQPGERLGLHAAKIEFAHPKTGNIMSFESEWPADFKSMIEKAEKSQGPL